MNANKKFDIKDKIRGAPKIDLPLTVFSLTISVLTSLFSITLLLGGTNIVVLVEAILEEEKPYFKPV